MVLGKKIFKWASNVVSILMIGVLLVMVIAVISSKASGGEPSFFGHQIKTVLSGSMDPTFKTGSIIAVDPIQDKNKLQKGDIITFRHDAESLVTHRINKVVNQNGHVMYQTKGDHNKAPDGELVLPQNVVAEYTGFTIPYLGYFMNFAQSKWGTALLLIVPGVLLLIYAIVSILQAVKMIEASKPAEAAVSAAPAGDSPKKDE